MWGIPVKWYWHIVSIISKSELQGIRNLVKNPLKLVFHPLAVAKSLNPFDVWDRYYKVARHRDRINLQMQYKQYI